MTTTRCSLDGSVRTVIAREPDAVTYRCPWCRGISIERVTTSDNTGEA